MFLSRSTSQDTSIEHAAVCRITSYRSILLSFATWSRALLLCLYHISSAHLKSPGSTSSWLGAPAAVEAAGPVVDMGLENFRAAAVRNEAARRTCSLAPGDNEMLSVRLLMSLILVAAATREFPITLRALAPPSAHDRWAAIIRALGALSLGDSILCLCRCVGVLCVATATQNRMLCSVRCWNYTNTAWYIRGMWCFLRYFITEPPSSFKRLRLELRV